jgi:hypothetical protein
MTQRLFPLSSGGVDFIQNGIDDVVFMSILYPNKILANIHVSWLDPNKVRSITVVGSRKMVVYNDIADNKIAICDKGIERKAVLGENMDYDNQHFPLFNYRSGDVLLPKINFQEPSRRKSTTSSIVLNMVQNASAVSNIRKRVLPSSHLKISPENV